MYTHTFIYNHKSGNDWKKQVSLEFKCKC